MAESTGDAVAWRRYEQNRPRAEVAIDTSVYEDYAGFYRPFYGVSTKDRRPFTRVVGQSDLQVFPESEAEFS